MKGERLVWFMLASRLHITVQELRRKTTSSEFVEWMQFLEMEYEMPSRSDMYAIQTAAEINILRQIVCSIGSKQRKRIQARFKDFILKFHTKKKEVPRLSREEEDRRAKTYFGALLGIKFGDKK